MRERPVGSKELSALSFMLYVLCPFVFLFAVSCEKTKDMKAVPTVVKTKDGTEMVLIPAGWFEMGSRKGKADESPVHKVWIDSFLMDRYEVTQEQYSKRVMGNPSHFKGTKNPMEQVSWAYAVLYCNARSRAEGLQPCYNEETGECNFGANGYRLPTEAEWEYACRAGTNTYYFFGRETRRLNDYVWYAENSAGRTHPVGQKKPNPLGLCDMYGNVAEWCNDVYDENYYNVSPERNPRGPAEGKKRVLRGGSWNSNEFGSSYRIGEDPGFQDACFARDDIGFRCVRTAESKSEKNSLKTGFIYHDIYLQHKTGTNHLERHQRLEAIVARLNEKLSGEGADSSLQLITPSPASTEWLTTIHTPEYIERVRKASQNDAKYMDSIDTSVSAKSYESAVMAVGGVLTAIDNIMAGKIRNAFCAVRPPGHHALKDRAMGFCLFNNVAIGARYAQRKHGLSKVLIVDWDVHHGNGTQDAFYDDPTVLYFSVHRYPFYPGSGSEEEKGVGKGFGYTVNVPLPAGSGDEVYKKAFEEILRPKAITFDPDFVLISAGFDAHKDDPLGGMNVTARGFEEMTLIVKKIAEKCCKGRLVSVLEGGYDLDGLAESVEAHISVLMN